MSDAEHREFLNRFYGFSRHFYDLTRKFFLFGRDTAIDRLLAQEWSTLVEVGPGTGRNLRMLHSGRPSARLGGVDASDAMLDHARARCPWAVLEQGFAEEADYTAVLGTRPDAILFSYSLSMIQDPAAAIDQARAHLAPGGEVWVVDFGHADGLVGPAQSALSAWLRLFHVHPMDQGILSERGAIIEHGPARYWFLARVPQCSETSTTP